jgi:putative oxidoreductase
VRPTHPPPGRDAALLMARLALGTILFWHGYQALGVLGRTGLEHVSIPVAIVSASVVTVVEVVCGLLLVVGLLTPAVAVSTGVVLVGAAAYVHVVSGTAAPGGWELVGAIVVALAALAAAGPGRFGLAQLVRHRPARPAPGLPRVTPHAAPYPANAGQLPGKGFFDEPIPPAGLPLLPLVRLSPAAQRDRPSRPGE